MAGARRFDDLDAYKLAVQLRREIVRLSTRRMPGRDDFRFWDQIRDAARGGPRNIAEGFSREAPAEFSRFLVFARASIDETRNHIVDGHESGYVTAEDLDRVLVLVRRTIGAINGLMAYLASPEAERAYRDIRTRRHAIRRDRTKEADNPRT